MGVAGFVVLRTEPGWYLRLRYPLPYRTYVETHARNYDLPPALLAGVIYTESKFDPTARSSEGAIGLMQLLPTTGQAIADRTGGRAFTPDDLLDPEISIRYGAWYLRNLRRKYADRDDGADVALAAYNAGQANVDRWLAAAPAGVPLAIPFAETAAFVERVHRAEHAYVRGWGLGDRG